MMTLPELIPLLLGAVVGLILALTGAGGGILAVPMLLFGLHLTMQEAAPVGLLAVGLAAAIGALLAWREGRLRYRAAGLIGGAGMLSAPAGVWIAHHLPSTPLTLGFALVLVYASLRMIRQKAGEQGLPATDKLPCVTRPDSGRLRWTSPCFAALFSTGLLSGLLSGALGVGGGFVIVPALSRFTNLDQRSIVATSLGVIAVVSVGGVAAAAAPGSFDWALALPFAGGAGAGLLLGRRWSRRLSGPRLQQLFGLVGLLVAALLVWRLSV